MNISLNDAKVFTVGGPTLIYDESVLASTGDTNSHFEDVNTCSKSSTNNFSTVTGQVSIQDYKCDKEYDIKYLNCINKGLNSDDMHTGGSSSENDESSVLLNLVWIAICFLGIMLSFVSYGLLLEYTTLGER